MRHRCGTAAAIAACGLMCFRASAADTGFLLGDLNCDGSLSLSDLVTCCELLAEQPGTAVTAAGIENADLDRDGILSLSDARQISVLLRTAPYDLFADYQAWAETVGYGTGLLTPQDPAGINQDSFRTFPEDPAYRSGRIVIGDSRCCQLGIFGQRTGRRDFAVFAVWGGHYGRDVYILGDDIFAEVQACFAEQIRACGSCEIALFATVNDYDFRNGQNADHIAAAVAAAEKLCAMRVTCDGMTYAPHLTVIGFDGCRRTGDLYGTPQEVFNRFVPDYNNALRAACAESTVLSAAGTAFAAVPELTGGDTGFIDDGLHYSDAALHRLTSFLIS